MDTSFSCKWGQVCWQHRWYWRSVPVPCCYPANMTDHEPGGELAMAALLTDELRGRLYRLVRRRHQLSRDEAAAELGISRGLAAFHLDKPVAAGLLRARSRAAEGPPRVGRRPKVYEPSDLELEITIPARRYGGVGELRADAVAKAPPDEPPLAAATRVATARGTELGAHFRQRRGLGRLGPERALTPPRGPLEAA